MENKKSGNFLNSNVKNKVLEHFRDCTKNKSNLEVDKTANLNNKKLLIKN